ncbi:hypothetical protein BOTBODRAFT_33764 [Botryobasidium botryosum FD-172 SS1]|uniref:Uncharacterized protein n=1 Tax=Botryobasidium botryosum (strain FD-172 SS1) TaxID=930990 RepID=A0A067MNI9_BOTB1|nr:hypothetical protein BOTBODRAFT_33764 [Botryobasidium botryosum FD-172 SS1]
MSEPVVLPPLPIGNAELETDYNAVVRHSALKGYQTLSLLTPPVYIIANLVRRRPFYINRLLRATWISGVAGTATGAGLGWARLHNADAPAIKDRRLRIEYNQTQIRNDDYSTIGSVLFAILTPALFWKRASIVNLILGGAGIGSAVGVLTHLGKSFSEGEEIKPEGMRDVVEGAIKREG